jgi:hypothetical protein
VITEVPIFIVKTDKGLIANNVGPGIEITVYDDYLHYHVWHRQLNIDMRDIRLFALSDQLHK